MARKKVDPAVAKAKKQKKQAIILSSMLLAVMAFSIPFSIKKFKALNAPPPAVAAAPVAAPTPVPAADGTVTPISAPVDAGAAAVASAAPAPALSEQPAPEPVEGQLVEFGRFEAKDPFVQQVGGYKKPASIEGAAAGPTLKPTVEAPAPGGAASPGALPPSSTPALPGSGPATGTPTAPPAATAAPPTAVLTSATISVNGGAGEIVKLDGSFPSQEPLFKLVALTKKGAKIGVVDGNYASGDPTVALTVGKKLTLMNTADGTRYEILLVSVA